MNTWRPLTESDTLAPEFAPLPGLAFTLSDADKANAAAARYYLTQHVRRLNELDGAKDQKR